jgi:hypothetical protein
MPYFLVGAAASPGTATRPERWLRPDAPYSTAKRIAQVAGWTSAQFLAVFTHRTMLWTTSRRMWATEGKRRAEEIQRTTIQAELAGIVVIGGAVAQHFGLENWPRFRWSGAWVRPIAILPPMCSRSGYWDDAANVKEARDFLRTLAPPLPRPD